MHICNYMYIDYTNAYIDLNVTSTLRIIVLVAPVKVVAVKLEMTILLNIVETYVGLPLCEDDT